jgi:hypothetical protein
MLDRDYSQCSLGRGRGSFVEFSNSKIQNVFKELSCPTSIESNLATFTPVSSAQQLQVSYQEESLLMDTSFNTNRACPRTDYGSYSPMTAFVNPQSLISGFDNSHGSSTTTEWWPQSLVDNRYQYQVTCGVPLTYDGVPKCQTQQPQQQYSDLWNTVAQGTGDWTSQTVDSTTISPKVLTLNVSSTLSSESESSQEAMIGLSEPGTVVSSSKEVPDQSCPEVLAVVEPVPRPHRQRENLSESAPTSRRIVPVLPGNDFAQDGNSKTRSTKVIKSPNSARMKPNPVPTNTLSTKHLSSWRAGVTARRPKKIEPKYMSPEPESPRTTLPQSSTKQAMHHRDAKDDFLVRSKLAGMSYKEIRSQGQFSEAESTLRGRFRTLTKHKTARVRKPEWGDNDVSRVCSVD